MRIIIYDIKIIISKVNIKINSGPKNIISVKRINSCVLWKIVSIIPVITKQH